MNHSAPADGRRYNAGTGWMDKTSISPAAKVTCLLHLSPTIRLLQPLRSGMRSSVLLAAGAACCGQVMRQHHSSLLALLLSSNPDAATTDAPLLGTLEADTSPPCIYTLLTTLSQSGEGAGTLDHHLSGKGSVCTTEGGEGEQAASAHREMAECGRKALSLLEAARSRYESLQISDDVFGESGDDSSDNPFYSTSGDSDSDNYIAEAGEEEQQQPKHHHQKRGDKEAGQGWGPGAAGGGPPGSISPSRAEEEGWTDVLHDVTVPAYKDTHGPTQKMAATATALDFFQLFVPDNCIQNMVVQTNMYAKKFQERFGSDEGWRPVTAEEMKAFLGFVTSTSVHRCESVLSIWSSGFFSNRSIALKMSQSRFEKILKYFHIVAFRPSQGSTQGLYKIQPFLDSLQQSFGCTFRPAQTQVLHEPLIDEDPVFITTCTERELRKRKKKKFSLWVRQCTSTGFICQVSVHLKEGQGSDGLAALKNKPQLHSLVAKQLCQNICGKNAIIFTGPSMTSLSLFSEFSKQDIFCCGLLSTRKSDCTGLPQSMLVCGSTPAQRGHSRITMKDSLSLISWYNKGHFRFLTNAYSPTKQGVIIKRKSGEIPCPLAVEAFAAHLSYICKYDDKYSKYFIFHKPNKTWQQVFWLSISIAINNAYILYKMSEAYAVKRYSRAQFGERLVRELLDLDECSPTQ